MPEQGLDTTAGSVAILVFKDHVIACPDVLNSARAWAAAGWRVDLLAFDTGLFPQPVEPVPGVRVRLLRTLYARLLPLARARRPGGTGATATFAAPATPGAAVAPTAVDAGRVPGPGTRLYRLAAAGLRALQKLEFVVFCAWRLLRDRHRLAIPCDPPSLVAARAARALGGPPHLYHSRELALSWDAHGTGARAARHVERACLRRALFTIIQDRARAALLGRDAHLPAAAFEIVPNAPIGLWEGGASDLLHGRLGLAPQTPIVLHAGVVAPETMVLEIVESISGWPAGPVLVVHGSVESGYEPRLRAAAERFPGRVHFSTGLIAPGEVDRLYASAAVGLAFYRPIDDNFRHVGHAAGKLFNCMKVGVPVIANDLPGLRELLEGAGCGRVVADPAGIGAALGDLLARRGECRERCREAFPRYEFLGNYRAVIRRAAASL